MSDRRSSRVTVTTEQKIDIRYEEAGVPVRERCSNGIAAAGSGFPSRAVMQALRDYQLHSRLDEPLNAEVEYQLVTVHDVQLCRRQIHTIEKDSAGCSRIHEKTTIDVHTRQEQLLKLAEIRTRRDPLHTIV